MTVTEKITINDLWNFKDVIIDIINNSKVVDNSTLQKMIDYFDNQIQKLSGS